MVAQGLGVSIVNALLAGFCRDLKFSSRPFNPRISYQLGVATLENTPAPALSQAFAKLLVDATAASLGPKDGTRLLAA
jgi:hypothetical protein